MGAMVSFLPLDHPIQPGVAQADVILLLVNRGAQSHHAAAQGFEFAARGGNIARHHFRAEFRVVGKHQLDLPVSPGENQVQLLLEILQAEPDSLGDGIALPIAAIQAFVLAEAGQVDGDDEFHRLARETAAYPVCSLAHLIESTLIPGRGKQGGGVFGAQALSLAGRAKDLLERASRFRQARPAFEPGRLAGKILTEGSQLSSSPCGKAEC